MSRESPDYREINRQAKKAIRRDVRAYNTRIIEREIEDNLNMRVLRSKQSRGKNRISCMRDTQGNTRYEKEKIMEIIKKFYEDLYAEKVHKLRTAHNRQEVRNIRSEEISDVTRDEVRAAIKEMKNRKSLGKDRVTAEMLKEGGGQPWKKRCACSSTNA